MGMKNEPLILPSPLGGEGAGEGRTPCLLGADTPLKEGNALYPTGRGVG